MPWLFWDFKRRIAMVCTYLSIYSSSEFSWKVASCSAREENYIPSIADLEKLCQHNHTRCPFFRGMPKEENGVKQSPVFSLPLAC
jgi:hypothetical protein